MARKPKTKKPKLSRDASLMLMALPKEPIAHSVPDLATDIFGGATSKALSRAKAALKELNAITFTETVSTRPYGHKVHYGIRADKWQEVMAVWAG